ncbi:hypothetical protein A2U01_0047766 [Trifolium medium]|uniref:Uncharacterized protein n=1 Tax=Trifolium medium TaxID=97028 RepID=A0A392QSH4_9FABA|nr:hypothetical protein [Trifolium medium]
MPKNRLRGHDNTSSLVIRTPMGYRLDPSCSLSSAGTSSSTAQSQAAVDFEEMERRLKVENDARVQAKVASQLQSRLDAMRSQLRAESKGGHGVNYPKDTFATRYSGTTNIISNNNTPNICQLATQHMSDRILISINHNSCCRCHIDGSCP